MARAMILGVGLLLGGCAAITQPIEVTPALIEALGKDPASACMVNQGSANAPLYGTGNATSTFCRTNAPLGTLSVGRDGTISITHGQVTPTVNVPVAAPVPMTLSPTK